MEKYLPHVMDTLFFYSLNTKITTNESEYFNVLSKNLQLLITSLRDTFHRGR